MLCVALVGLLVAGVAYATPDIGGPLPPLIAVVGFVLGFGLIGWILVRFAPAAAVTIASGEYAFLPPGPRLRARLGRCSAPIFSGWWVSS
jgi:xanthosine utilization system XapX-like protein